MHLHLQIMFIVPVMKALYQWLTIWMSMNLHSMCNSMLTIAILPVTYCNSQAPVVCVHFVFFAILDSSFLVLPFDILPVIMEF